MNASTSLHISGSAETLSKSLKAFLGVNAASCLPTCDLLIKSLSEEGQGLLLTAAQESRSAYDKGSTSPRCLKILSYILKVSSSSRRWTAPRGGKKCSFFLLLLFVCLFMQPLKQASL